MSESQIVATTQVPEPQPLPMVQHMDWPSWFVSAIAGAFATILWLRRRVSRDRTEMSKDRAEENLLETLRAERDRAMNEAREAWARRTKDAERIAGLEAENGFLKQEVDRMGKQVSEMQLRLDMVMSALSALKPDFKFPASPTPA